MLLGKKLKSVPEKTLKNFLMLSLSLKFLLNEKTRLIRAKFRLLCNKTTLKKHIKESIVNRNIGFFSKAIHKCMTSRPI